MTNKIKHIGKIDSVTRQGVKVRILQASACSSCKASRLCNASEKKEKLVDVSLPDASSRYHVGDDVVVVASRATGMKAVLIGFGLPFLVLVAVLFGAMKATGNEPLAALLSLAALVHYYLVVYAFRRKLYDEFRFTLE